MYNFILHLGSFSGSTYSPLSFTPRTEARLEVNQDEAHYYELIRRAIISRINAGVHPSRQYHVRMTGGSCQISQWHR
jgi:hypothetical protein